MEIRKGEPIRRKAEIPDEVRTEARDRAADAIERMWPADYKAIAQEADYSRQHVKNTLDLYFEPAREAEDATAVVRGHELRIPEDVDEVSYLRGVADGMAMERQRDV